MSASCTAGVGRENASVSVNVNAGGKPCATEVQW